MSSLDERLNRIAKNAASPDSGSSESERRSERVGASDNAGQGQSQPSRHLGLLAILSLVAVGLIALMVFSFKDAAVYAKTVDQVLAEQDHLMGRRLRVEGTLVHGSLKKRDDPCEYRFKIRSSGKALAVHYPKCVLPDTFQDRPETNVKVTAEGFLSPKGFFEASLIMAKCPSKYEKKGGKVVPVGNY